MMAWLCVTALLIVVIMLIRSPGSLWGMGIPLLCLPLIDAAKPDMFSLRMWVALAMCVTVLMLFNRRWRDYVLLPSGLALAGGLATMTLNLGIL
ncbi:DUF1435 family protein [Enterobacillus tribolii]|uniref:Uncharacterized protein DUF1435 n=2 Tax=Enterobacillus tribolii TaxID=1487935 RepID=A0A370QR91_9GAMM|nr:DUF1435 family protein [Enterobacillus tribolii]RDK90937.1 uncharacterized protein DUF1435 [Enterobacillus tribolii]